MALYLPTEKPARAPAPAAIDLASQLSTFKPAEAAAAVATFESTPENIERRTRRSEIAPGLKVALLPEGKTRRSCRRTTRPAIRNGTKLDGTALGGHHAAGPDSTKERPACRASRFKTVKPP
jgi:hypothetical protein